MTQRYQQLNPLAFAVAAGCAALIASVLIGFPMMGLGGMMGGYGAHGGGPWGYHSGNDFGFGMLFWLGGTLLVTLVGAIFAWIYNAVNAAPASSSGDTSEHRSTTDLPAPQ